MNLSQEHINEIASLIANEANATIIQNKRKLELYSAKTQQQIENIIKESAAYVLRSLNLGAVNEKGYYRNLQKKLN